ncbi:DUF262 domain-containing protein [Pluralibacter gergoviae]|uniref:DUF262 domain-containing protein n=1 Tax=Pluralibacter gergoviae TaxID=61647 RepID=UPI00290751BC|nr:DUF262 domain-containing protein [Pluralibacter gergoviae]MDU4003410.1 DUF262 domain-containing protein [Pluralibacter gergoviae]
MNGYFIIRLGADSEHEIRRIDSVTSYEEEVFPISVNCKQVPKGVSKGDVAIIWLGTNNNKGGKTPWIQGIRAFGRIVDVSGEEDYSSTKQIDININIVMPVSVTKMDIVTSQSNLYAEIAAMPVLGVNNYSSQVVQRIDPTKPGQSIQSLLLALEAIVPGLCTKIESNYPDLYSGFTINTNAKHSSKKSEENIQIESTGSIAESDFDPEEDRELEIETPFDPSKIDIIVKPMTIGSLEDRLDNNELDLTPDFQRQANLWDIKRKSRLIESILLRIPLPSFYFSEDVDGSYSVVDGLQRLCTIFHFKNVSLLNSVTGSKLAPLELRGLQYLNELEGKSYLELDRKFQRRVAELEITANIIRANTPFAVKFNVFARLNQGGLPLNAQEIRNAIFPGEWRSRIRNLSDSDIFIKVTEKKVQKLRQQDMELVLRFIAIWQLGSPYTRPANQTLDEFLNMVVESELSKWDGQRWYDASNAFYTALDAVYAIRGKHAFRKSVGLQSRGPINRGLFEAEMVVFGSLDTLELDFAKKNRELLEEFLSKALTEDSDFIRALSFGTGSSESSNIRVRTLAKIFKEAKNA